MSLPKNKYLIFSIIWLLVGIYGLIFRESSGSLAPPFPHFDKMVHFFLFLVQMILFCKAYLQQNQRIPALALWLFALVYAVASEWAQGAFTLTRQADVWDALADMCGASVALCVAMRVQAARKNRANTKS